MLGSEWDVRWSLRGRGLGVDCGVGRINVEKRFLREATPVMRGDSGASQFSSDEVSSVDWGAGRGTNGGKESRTLGSL